MLAVLTLGLLGVTAVRCSFSPRDAPLPCTPGVDPNCNTPPDIQPPISPTVVMDNINKSLRKRGVDGPNVEPYYRDQLSELFFYVPDADAEVAAAGRTCPPGVPYFVNWDRQREVQFMLEVLQNGTVVPDSVTLTYLSRVEADPFPETDKTRYNVQYVLSLVYAGSDSTARRLECFGATSLWDFNGLDRNDCRLLRWEDTGPLQNVSCPGGTYGGTIGALKAVAGSCNR